MGGLSMNEIGYIAEPQAQISKDTTPVDTSSSLNEIGDVGEPRGEPNAKFSQDTSHSMNENGDVAEPKVGIPNNTTSLEKSKCPICQALFKDYEQLVDHF